MKTNNLSIAITNIMHDDLESLNSLHKTFKPLLLKYSSFLSLDINELISELDLIFIKIYKAGIIEDIQILKYIKVSFKNYKKFKISESDLFPNFDLTTELESNFLFYDLIKDFNEKTQKILELKFLKQYTNSEIANHLGVSKQYISKKLNSTLNDLQKTFN